MKVRPVWRETVILGLSHARVVATRVNVDPLIDVDLLQVLSVKRFLTRGHFTRVFPVHVILLESRALLLGVEMMLVLVQRVHRLDPLLFEIQFRAGNVWVQI